jgi:hypothetical protein
MLYWFMKVAITSLAVFFGLVLVQPPALAHHSFFAVFDSSKPVTLKGVITKVEWLNPHIYFYVDVKDSRGNTVNWAVQIAGPQSLARRGWTKNTLRTQEHITVMGYRARGDANVAAAREVVLSDGRKFYTGCANDGGPE